MPIVSAAQASLAVRWETMDTMVCSLFSAEKSEACASVDLLLAPLNREIGAVNCSFVAMIIPVSGVGGEGVVMVRSAAGG